MAEPLAHLSNKRVFSREALDAFIRNLTDRFAPEKVILFGSQARGDARQDSDADILVVMHDQGRPFDKTRESCVAEDNPVVPEWIAKAEGDGD